MVLSSTSLHVTLGAISRSWFLMLLDIKIISKVTQIRTSSDKFRVRVIIRAPVVQYVGNCMK
jgi:hypothetical protein